MESVNTLTELRVCRLEQNIRRSFLIRLFICSFGFSIATIVLLWGECGLTLSDVFLLQTIFSLMSAVTEVPTGYFADVMGRKRSMTIGCALLCMGAACYCFANHFFVFLLAEVLLAIGFSLASGADEALVHDSLLELGREEEFGVIWSRMTLFTFLGTSVFTITGGIASVYWIRLPSWMSLAGMCVLFVIVYGLVEPARDLSRHAPRLWEIVEVSRYCLVKNRRIRWLILFPALLFACVQGGFWLYQPYLKLAGMDQSCFGFVYASFNLVAGLASWKFTKRMIVCNERTVSMGLVMVTALSFVLMGLTISSFGVLFAALHQMVRGVGPVLYSAYLNKVVSSSRRATVLSLKSMIGKVIYASILLLLSLYGEQEGVSMMYIILAAGTLITGFLSIAAIYIE